MYKVQYKRRQSTAVNNSLQQPAAVKHNQYGVVALRFNAVQKQDMRGAERCAAAAAAAAAGSFHFDLPNI